MSDEQTMSVHTRYSDNGRHWRASSRGRQMGWLDDVLTDSLVRCQLAGGSEQEPDGTISFHASDAHVMQGQAEAQATGRSFEQIGRSHLVVGVDVRGQDGLVLTMAVQPHTDACGSVWCRATAVTCRTGVGLPPLVGGPGVSGGQPHPLPQHLSVCWPSRERGLVHVGEPAETLKTECARITWADRCAEDNPGMPAG